MDVIRCDDNESLIVKWSRPGKSGNDIQLGSSLRVKSGQVALFLYKQDEQTYEDYIEGPFDEILVTKNIPIISGILKLAYHGNTPFQAEVYFINVNKIINTRIGIPYFDVFDYEHKEFSVPISVRGAMNFKVTDYKELIKLFGPRTLTNEEYHKFIDSAITRYIKATVTNIPEEMHLSCLKLETQINFISQVIGEVLKDRLKNEFGSELVSLDISALEVNKESEDYEMLLKITKKLTMKQIMHKARIGRIKDDVAVLYDAATVASHILDVIIKAKGVGIFKA